MLSKLFDKKRRLIKLAEKGNTAKVLSLLKRGADINATDKAGWTALHSTIAMSHWETAEALIAAGAEVNTRRKEILLNTTPLMDAAARGSSSTVKALLAAGADVNAATTLGTTALIYAASDGNADVVRLLLDAGADVHARNDRNNALSAALWSSHTEVSQLLRAAGATLNLPEAAQSGDTERVQQLIPTATAESLGLALVRAAEGKHAEIVAHLLAAGANVNTQDEDGNTALHDVARWGHTVIVAQLLTAGADANIHNDDRETAFWLAVWAGRTEILRMLLANQEIKNINRKVDGTTMLHMAAAAGHAEIVRMLIDAGADIHLKNTYFKETPLASALNHNRKEVAEILRAAGAVE